MSVCALQHSLYASLRERDRRHDTQISEPFFSAVPGFTANQLKRRRSISVKHVVQPFQIGRFLYTVWHLEGFL
jgi:hypothetical protein